MQSSRPLSRTHRLRMRQTAPFSSAQNPVHQPAPQAGSILQQSKNPRKFSCLSCGSKVNWKAATPRQQAEIPRNLLLTFFLCSQLAQRILDYFYRQQVLLYADFLSISVVELGIARPVGNCFHLRVDDI